MRVRTFLGMCFVLLWLAAAPPARADLFFATASDGVPTNEFVIPGVGQTVDVQVYLVETNGSVLSTERLFAAGVQMRFDSPSGVAAVLSPDHVTPNAAFNDPGSIEKLVTAASAKLSEATDGLTLVSPDAQNRILLGTFRFTGLSEGSVSLTLLRFNPAPDDRIITGQANVLDALVTQQLPVTISVVPEPGSLALMGLAAFGMTGIACIRRRKTRLAGEGERPGSAVRG
jgi:hypothetical protein